MESSDSSNKDRSDYPQLRAPPLSSLDPPTPYPVKGFNNYSNSCFMNSIVQLLVNSPLVELIQRGEKLINRCITDVIHSYRNSPDAVVSLRQLRDALNCLKEGGLYHERQIYDAADFFSKLTNQLDSSILQAFAGVKQISQNCELCQSKVEYTQEFRSITFGSQQLFEFPFDNRRYLHELIKPEEQMESCLCGEQSNYIVGRIVEYPRALLFEVARAEPKKKCHNYAFFAQQFQITDSKGTHRYRLYGLLYHKGLQTDGHYTCKVRASNGEFYYVDDGHVEQSFVQERSATATLLLYFRCSSE